MALLPWFFSDPLAEDGIGESLVYFIPGVRGERARI